MNIAVCLQSRDHFGAQIVHIPALLEIRKKHPSAKIIGFSKFPYSQFLKELGYVDEIHIGKGLAFYFRQFRKNRIDCIYSLQRSSIAIDISAFILRISNYTKYSDKGVRYSKEFYRARVLHKLITDNQNSYESACQEIRKEFINSPASPYYIIVPGAGGKEKRVSLDILTNAIECFSEGSNIEPIVVLGPEEAEEANYLDRKKIKVIKSPKVSDLFELIVNSEFVLSVDCGPSHIAHITSHPQIVIFIETLVEWFDFRDNNIAINGNGDIKNITSDMILEAMQSLKTRA